jgi:bacterioferritin-associated ferredoxin
VVRRDLGFDCIMVCLGAFSSMIVCSCNVLSDHDVRSAVAASKDAPRNAKQIWRCLGRNAECGSCARAIKAIIYEAICGYAKDSGSPFNQTNTYRAPAIASADLT